MLRGFFVFLPFDDVFSVSFQEAGGKLAHRFCFLSSSVLRHLSDPHQIVPDLLYTSHLSSYYFCFLFLIIFNRWFLSISIVGHVHLYTPG